MTGPGGAAIRRPSPDRAIPPWRDIRVLRAASQVAIVVAVALVGLWLFGRRTVKAAAHPVVEVSA